ncbi:MAG: thioesterase family protein [Pseudomonadota bacterium]
MIDQKKDLTELLELLGDIYEERIPFNKFLGLQVERLELDNVCVRINMKKEFIGNYFEEMLHGGIISSVLDLTGALTAQRGALEKIAGGLLKERAEIFLRMGTIDLRIDYLRPGRGKYFLATGSILRAGKKFVVTRMQLHNDKESLIAVGTGTYIVP